MASRMIAASSAAVVAAAALAAPAAALWLSTAPAQEPSYASGLLSPATALAATAGCDVVVLDPIVDLSWDASVSTRVTGYDIRRSSDSTSYTTIATLTGRESTAYRDETVTGLGTTYWYQVRAVQNNWYADSTAVDVTTPTLCT